MDPDLVNNDKVNSSTPTAAGVTGLLALTGKVVGSNVELFATSYGLNELSPSFLFEITDNLDATSISQVGGEQFSVVDAAPAGTLIRVWPLRPHRRYRCRPQRGSCCPASGVSVSSGVERARRPSCVPVAGRRPTSANRSCPPGEPQRATAFRAGERTAPASLFSARSIHNTARRVVNRVPTEAAPRQSARLRLRRRRKAKPNSRAARTSSTRRP